MRKDRLTSGVILVPIAYTPIGANQPSIRIEMTNNTIKILSLALSLIVAVLSGCTGSGTFHDHARAGDTVAVAAGWAHHLQRGNIKVTITDSAGTETVYTPGQPGYDAVKGSINFYPDPVSSMVVSERINKNLTLSAITYANLIKQQVTLDDADWWETVIFVDLPDPMALGDATIDIVDLTSPAAEAASSIVTIVPNETGIGTGGSHNAFEATLGAFSFNMGDTHFQALERVPHYEVAFSGSTVPYAIQVDFTHDPDEAHSGTGTAYVINPLGHIKNISWAPIGTSGTDFRAIITPAYDGAITNMNDFKFYVAGGVTGLALNGTAQAFNVDGGTIGGVGVTINN